MATVFKQYLGVDIAVTGAGKFVATVDGREMERAKVADIERAIREAQIALKEPIPAVSVDQRGNIRRHQIVGWDAKAKRFVTSEYGQPRTIGRYWTLCRPDDAKELALRALNDQIGALEEQREAILKGFVPLTLEDLVAAGREVPEMEGTE
jgi:hypothetical protein